MTTWGELLKAKGSFISEPLATSNSYENYIPKIKLNYTYPKDSLLKVYMSTSDDQVNWSNWIEIVNEDIDIFYNKRKSEKVYVKYKVIMESKTLEDSPTFNSFEIILQKLEEFINLGDEVCKPKLWVTKTVSDGNISIENLTNNIKLELNNLKLDEEVFIDCENEDVITSLPLTYRYDDHNDIFVEFDIGKNLYVLNGDFKLDMKLQFKTLQG